MAAAKSEKRKLIDRMLKMQKKFIKYEQAHGVDPAVYFNSPENHPLHKYKEQYDEMATKVVDLAH